MIAGLGIPSSARGTLFGGDHQIFGEVTRQLVERLDKVALIGREMGRAMTMLAFTLTLVAVCSATVPQSAMGRQQALKMDNSDVSVALLCSSPPRHLLWN